MSKQVISLGTAPTGVGGDTPRSAFTKAQANFDELYVALGGSGSPVALPPALPIAKGGTGGTTQAAARSGLGLGSAAVANILGTVSQSGGVPTGAIMEAGTNGTGSWWKFASGLMITSQMIASVTPAWSAGTVRYTNVTGGLVVAFADLPLLYVQARDGNISDRSCWCTLVSAPTVSTYGAWFSAPNGTTGINTFGFNLFGIGRWF